MNLGRRRGGADDRESKLQTTPAARLSLARVAELTRWLADSPVEGVAGLARSPGQVLIIDCNLLCHLIGSRLATSAWPLAMTGEEHLGSRLAPDLAMAPVNPVLLCSAIAQRALTGTDPGGVISCYESGSAVSGLYAHHFLPPGYDGERQIMDKHLALEERLLDTLCVLAVARLMTHWPWPNPPDHIDPSASPVEQWARLAIMKDPSVAAGISDREAVRLEVWSLVNPTYLARESDEHLECDHLVFPLISEGLNNDKVTVKLVRQMEREQREQAEAFNSALRADGSPEEKRLRLAAGRPARELAAVRLRRARRLYTWSPHEIQARWAAANDRKVREAEERP